MTVEDNVFLLGFIDVYPVDGLGDILKLLLGDGIAAMGETLPFWKLALVTGNAAQYSDS